jgi:hypothetical protein
MARRVTTVALFQEARELFRRKSKSDGIPHEQQPRDGFIGVVPEAAVRPRRARYDTDALVVADQIRTDAGATGRLANSKRLAGHALSYNVERFQVQHQVCA